MSAAFLHALRDFATPAATAAGAGKSTLHQLSADPDEQWALAFTRGPTEPQGRWGQAVLTLLTRGPRSNPDVVDDRADAIVGQLITAAGLTFGDTDLNMIDHRGGPSGPDSSKRTLRVDTFFLDLDYHA